MTQQRGLQERGRELLHPGFLCSDRKKKPDRVK
jgi:hypothetical protein